MKETLLQLGKYNAWANKRIIDVLLTLTEEQLNQQIISSFPTIRETTYHTWSAEDVWLQRLQLAETPVWRMANYEGTFQAACEAWMKTSATLVRFMEDQKDDNAFTHVVAYYNLKKEYYKSETGQILTHVFNHATYHRGQLVTMLRQAGVTKIPGSDFIAWPWNPKA